MALAWGGGETIARAMAIRAGQELAAQAAREAAERAAAETAAFIARQEARMGPGARLFTNVPSNPYFGPGRALTRAEFEMAQTAAQEGRLAPRSGAPRITSGPRIFSAYPSQVAITPRAASGALTAIKIAAMPFGGVADFSDLLPAWQRKDPIPTPIRVVEEDQLGVVGHPAPAPTGAVTSISVLPTGSVPGGSVPTGPITLPRGFQFGLPGAAAAPVPPNIPLTDTPPPELGGQLALPYRYTPPNIDALRMAFARGYTPNYAYGGYREDEMDIDRKGQITFHSGRTPYSKWHYDTGAYRRQLREKITASRWWSDMIEMGFNALNLGNFLTALVGGANPLLGIAQAIALVLRLGHTFGLQLNRGQARQIAGLITRGASSVSRGYSRFQRSRRPWLPYGEWVASRMYSQWRRDPHPPA